MNASMLPDPEYHARHETSRNRRGIDGENQAPIAALLLAAGERGETSAILGATLGRGHGQVSGALSTMHKNGHVAMLAEIRDGQHVYVLPQFVAGRATEPRRNVLAHDVLMEVHTALLSNDADRALRLSTAYVDRVRDSRDRPDEDEPDGPAPAPLPFNPSQPGSLFGACFRT